MNELTRLAALMPHPQSLEGMELLNLIDQHAFDHPRGTRQSIVWARSVLCHPLDQVYLDHIIQSWPNTDNHNLFELWSWSLKERLEEMLEHSSIDVIARSENLLQVFEQLVNGFVAYAPMSNRSLYTATAVLSQLLEDQATSQELCRFFGQRATVDQMLKVMQFIHHPGGGLHPDHATMLLSSLNDIQQEICAVDPMLVEHAQISWMENPTLVDVFAQCCPKLAHQVGVFHVNKVQQACRNDWSTSRQWLENAQLFSAVLHPHQLMALAQLANERGVPVQWSPEFHSQVMAVYLEHQLPNAAHPPRPLRKI